MASMAFRAWLGAGPVLGWCGLLAGCGTLTYYGKDPDSSSDSLEDLGDDDDDDDNAGDDDDDTPGDDDDTTWGDDDDSPPPGDDDDDTPVDSGTINTGACIYPSVGAPASIAGVASPDPSFVGVDFIGLVVGSEVHDFEAGGDQYSALLRFSFFDEDGYFICEVVYDASTAIPAVGWTTDSGGVLWAAFDVPLTGGSATSCPNFSFGDIRTWIESQSNWGFGIGPMVDLDDTLQPAVTESGGNWATDWAPYVYSLYVTGGPFAGPGQATEVSFANSLDHVCEEIPVDLQGYGTLVPPPVGAPLDHFVNGVAWRIFPPN